MNPHSAIVPHHMASQSSVTGVYATGPQYFFIPNVNEHKVLMTTVSVCNFFKNIFMDYISLTVHLPARFTKKIITPWGQTGHLCLDVKKKIWTFVWFDKCKYQYAQVILSPQEKKRKMWKKTIKKSQGTLFAWPGSYCFFRVEDTEWQSCFNFIYIYISC